MKKILAILACLIMFVFCNAYAQQQTEVLVDQENEQNVENVVLPSDIAKGMHLSQYVASSDILKNRLNDLLINTELNSVVIDVKEIDGAYSLKGIKGNIAYTSKYPDLTKYVEKLKEEGVYTIARIVVFRDNTLPRKRPDLAVQTPEGDVWQDYKKMTWLNPYKQEVRDYIFEICDKVVDMGFDEIQFDYIRFPSDGKIKNCRYGVAHSSVTAPSAVVEFLKQAKNRLEPKGIKISIDVFGLTTTEKSDMGIGQKIVEMTKYVDYVSPMVYPSHYPNGCYGIAKPNDEPYRTVYLALAGAIKRIPKEKLRPWLQDFSMKNRGIAYTSKEVKAQIQACFDLGIKTWLLWNPSCKYTKAGLQIKGNEDMYVKTSQEEINKLLKYNSVDKSINQSWKSKNRVKKSTQTANGKVNTTKKINNSINK